MTDATESGPEQRRLNAAIYGLISTFRGVQVVDQLLPGTEFVVDEARGRPVILANGKEYLPNRGQLRQALRGSTSL